MLLSQSGESESPVFYEPGSEFNPVFLSSTHASAQFENSGNNRTIQTLTDKCFHTWGTKKTQKQP